MKIFSKIVAFLIAVLGIIIMVEVTSLLYTSIRKSQIQQKIEKETIKPNVIYPKFNRPEYLVKNYVPDEALKRIIDLAQIDTIKTTWWHSHVWNIYNANLETYKIKYGCK